MIVTYSEKLSIRVLLEPTKNEKRCRSASKKTKKTNKKPELKSNFIIHRSVGAIKKKFVQNFLPQIESIRSFCSIG